jgi:hypothetical protein
VQASTDEVKRVAERLAELRAEYGRSEVPFDVNCLPLDIMPGAAGREAFGALAAHIEGLGMSATFQVVPWYFTGRDPNDLGVRRDAIEQCGSELIG